MGWITAEELEKHGYRRHAQHCRERSSALYQKMIYLGSAKLYAINFHEFDFSDCDGYPETMPRIAYEPEVQFNRQDGLTFNTTLLIHHDDDIEKVETFFRSVFWNMECSPYEGSVVPLEALAAQGE